jgi:hypothetical protein
MDTIHTCVASLCSLSLLECSPLILQHKTIKQKPYCRAMNFFQQILIFFQKIGKS